MKKIICCLLLALIFVFPTKADGISVDAKAAILINGDTGEIIYSKNEDLRLPMASTTKIMTALLLCENADFDEEITVSKSMLNVEGSSMGLLDGDKVTYHDLLYGLLLASGNDAANVVAIKLGGSVDNFVEMMNEKSVDLGLTNTHFATPSGLDADNHFTTAYDLSMLARYALSNEAFSIAAASRSATLCYGNPPYKRTLTNHNKLLKNMDGVIGVKTGFTKKSGRCLVSAIKRDRKFVIAVTLNDGNDWADHKDMLEYGLSQIEQSVFTPMTDKYSIPVINGDNDYVEVTIKPYTINTLEMGTVNYKINLPKFLYAPIDKNEIVGDISYKIDDYTLGDVKLMSENDVNANMNSPSFLTLIKNNITTLLINF